jgi:hypothetical protein
MKILNRDMNTTNKLKKKSNLNLRKEYTVLSIKNRRKKKI